MAHQPEELLTGGIDLSTGANVAMTGVLAPLLMQMGLPWPVAALLALAAGALASVLPGRAAARTAPAAALASAE